LHLCSQLSDLSPLAEAKALKSLTLPPNAKDFEFLRAFPHLERLGFAETNSLPRNPDKTAAEFWKEYDEWAWVRTLEKAGIKPVAVNRLGDGAWDVAFRGVQNVDLKLLPGLSIRNLNLGNTGIEDIGPIRGMPLTRLSIYGTKVQDLSPLKGMQLTSIHAAGTPISDISVLRGMPLTEVKLHACAKLTDLSPLAGGQGLDAVDHPAERKELRISPRVTQARAAQLFRDNEQRRTSQQDGRRVLEGIRRKETVRHHVNSNRTLRSLDQL
jgi:Leucine-rich repeat (LRR) protein